MHWIGLHLLTKPSQVLKTTAAAAAAKAKASKMLTSAMHVRHWSRLLPGRPSTLPWSGLYVLPAGYNKTLAGSTGQHMQQNE
jgi:hypothetical protein